MTTEDLLHGRDGQTLAHVQGWYAAQEKAKGQVRKQHTLYDV